MPTEQPRDCETHLQRLRASAGKKLSVGQQRKVDSAMNSFALAKDQSLVSPAKLEAISKVRKFRDGEEDVPGTDYAGTLDAYVATYSKAGDEPVLRRQDSVKASKRRRIERAEVTIDEILS